MSREFSVLYLSHCGLGTGRVLFCYRTNRFATGFASPSGLLALESVIGSTAVRGKGQVLGKLFSCSGVQGGDKEKRS